MLLNEFILNLLTDGDIQWIIYNFLQVLITIEKLNKINNYYFQ